MAEILAYALMAAREHQRRCKLMATDRLAFVGTYFCPACKRFFETLEELRVHEKSVHGVIH